MPDLPNPPGGHTVRPRCGVPCLAHGHHNCDRSPGHYDMHRDVQQKGDHTCEWETPGPKDVPTLLAEVMHLRARRDELTSLLNDPDRLAVHLAETRAVLSKDGGES
ncbi:hypothetical protein [Actinomadura litoris]|uniref:Uncharacterized protein n=1 Tax=Actinomadura litoris TaxID=2678616 RepID=A0A7K1LAX4_9ACTN|nr:hypothetical protein [Actinomadura litoris]MUN41473.1 hypothetical protein [Actinomadura litoris]